MPGAARRRADVYTRDPAGADRARPGGAAVILRDDGYLARDQDTDPAIWRVPTVRTSPQPSPPAGLCWHWTGPVTDLRALVERMARPVPPGGRAASWHLTIARDGAVYQSAPVWRSTWHAGSSWPNARLLGVELENWGWLRKVGPLYLADGLHRLPAARAVRASDGRWYDGWPEAQVAAATAVCGALARALRWGPEAVVHGHRDYAPKRREDPGLLWMDDVVPRVVAALWPAVPAGGPA